MARTKTKGTEVATESLPAEVVARVESEDAAARDHSELIIQQFGDGQPYERGRVISEAKFYMAQSAEAMLEAGKRLILIKEHEPHGEFIQIVEQQLGIHERAARRMMGAAIKFMSPKLEAKRTTLSVLGKAKLFELVSEDDDDLAALTEGGTVAGLTLDEVDRMSVRELRAALRDAKEKDEAKDQILQDRSARIDQLSQEMSRLRRRINKLTADEAEKELRKQAAEIAFEAEVAVTGNLREVCNTMIEHAEKSGSDYRPFLGGVIRHLELQLAALRDEFALPDADGAEAFAFLADDAQG